MSARYYVNNIKSSQFSERMNLILYYFNSLTVLWAHLFNRSGKVDQNVNSY